MRKFIFVWLSILCIFASVAWAEPYKGNKPKEVKERLITIRNWKLMEEFDLSGEKAQKVFDILKRYDKKREKLVIKRRKLLRRLRKDIKQPETTDDKLRSIINEIVLINVELARIPEQELKGLSEVFTQKELARFLLFSERFAREMQRIISRDGKTPKNMPR
jgi:hypothetical protein